MLIIVLKELDFNRKYITHLAKWVKAAGNNIQL